MNRCARMRYLGIWRRHGGVSAQPLPHVGSVTDRHSELYSFDCENVLSAICVADRLRRPFKGGNVMRTIIHTVAAALKSSGTTVIAARIDGSGYVAQFNALREL